LASAQMPEGTVDSFNQSGVLGEEIDRKQEA
jgi:hypothetical protein